MKKKYKIDFIGIRFSRCGTTWISKCLEDHPEICFSKPKEVQFFDVDFDYDKGPSYYENFFKCKKGENVRGEYSPEYFLHDKTIERIRKDAPNAKLIFTLRNPMDRAFSQYLYRQRKTGKVFPIEKIFDQDSIRIEERILYFGLYYKHLMRWVKDLPRDQYLILIHEDSRKDPISFIKSIYKFLGVNPDFVSPNLQKDINVTRGIGYKSRLIQNIFSKRVRMKRNKIGRIIIDFLKLFGVGKLSSYIMYKNLNIKDSPEKEKLSDGIRIRIKEYYKEDIRSLEKFVHRDLSFWK
jgi:hypothetical protein